MMERSITTAGLEEIFDEKLKAYASLDYKELKNPVAYYQNSILSKQFSEQRSCSRERGSPTLFLPTTKNSRSSPIPSPTHVLTNINNPNLISPNHKRISISKPDPWVINNAFDLNVEGNNCFNANIGGVNHMINGVNNNSISANYTRPSTPCDSSISPKRLGSPLLKSKVLANRDKESLLDEIIGLKKALLDQTSNLQRQKVLSTNLEIENRKLEKEIEDLVCQANNTKGVARQGHVASYDTRLRSKVQGLKTRVSQLEATCEMQQEELTILRRDMRVTRTRELEAERDVFAEEIERLQNFVRRLKILQNRLFCENKQLWRYKDRTSQLEATSQRLENSSNDLQKSLEKANKEIHETTRKGNESFIRAKRAERQCQDLQEQSSLLSKMVEKEKSEKLKLQQMIHVLQDEVQNLEASLSSKANLQGLPNVDHNQHEEHQSGILAKTWGFLHGSAFHTSKTRELDGLECEKLVLGERPKTRGEQRTKMASGHPMEGRKSRPRSPTKPTTTKKASEQPSTSGITQYRTQEASERRYSSASKNQRQEGEHHVGEKPTQANKPVQPPPMNEPAKNVLEEPTRKANLNSSEDMHQMGAPAEEEDPHQSKDAIANLVEGMIITQESTDNGEYQKVGNLQESKYGSKEASSPLLHEGAQPSVVPKLAPNVLVPRLNLNQVGGHPHHVEETNSEESSNALHTSATTSNMLSPSTTIVEAQFAEQSLQKVSAWNDNIHSSHEKHEALILPPPLDHKLAIIQESTIVDDD